METIHILGAGRWQIPTIKMVKELGVKILATDMNPNADGFRYADFHEVANITDVAETLKVARKQGIDGIMPISEYGVKTAAYIAEALGLVGLKPEIAEMAVDKELIAIQLKKHKIPTPETECVTDFNGAKMCAKQLGFPLVFKPTDNMGGSRGVKKVYKIEDLEDGFKHAMSFSKVKRLIIQEYVCGVEHDVDSSIYKNDHHVLTISDKIFPTEPKNHPHYNVRSLNYPTYAPPKKIQKIKDAVIRAAKAINIPFGPTHIEVIHNDEKEYVIDFAARGGGGHIFSTIIYHSSGVNAVQESARMFLGREPTNLDPIVQRGSVYYFFRTMCGGIVKNITGVEEARKIRGVADLEIVVKIGDVLKPLTHSTQRLGFCVAVGETRIEAESITKQVSDLVRIEIA